MFLKILNFQTLNWIFQVIFFSQKASLHNSAFDVAQWRSVAKIKFCPRKMRDEKNLEKWDSPPLRLRPGIHSYPPPHQHDHDHHHYVDHHQDHHRHLVDHHQVLILDHHRHHSISLAHHNGDCGRPVPEKFTLRRGRMRGISNEMGFKSFAVRKCPWTWHFDLKRD